MNTIIIIAIIAYVVYFLIKLLLPSVYRKIKDSIIFDDKKNSMVEIYEINF